MSRSSLRDAALLVQQSSWPRISSIGGQNRPFSPSFTPNGRSISRTTRSIADGRPGRAPPRPRTSGRRGTARHVSGAAVAMVFGSTSANTIDQHAHHDRRIERRRASPMIAGQHLGGQAPTPILNMLLPMRHRADRIAPGSASRRLTTRGARVALTSPAAACGRGRRR